MKHLILNFSLLLILLSCTPNLAKNNEVTGKPNFSFAAWSYNSSGLGKTDGELHGKLKEYSENGLTDLYLHESTEKLAKVAKIAGEYHIRVHAWILTLNHHGKDKIALEHPAWHAVNRQGKNSLEYRAYYDGYTWLSPFSPGAREHVKNNVRKLADIEGIESVHLDYVRYCDVILPEQIQPRYNLVQDHQMPEYDYDYHPIAREGFKKLFGEDPMEMKNPELSIEWLQYRLDALTTLVNELAEIAHSQGKQITAAVFPFPEMARQNVRQDWSNWKLDIALPMMYHNYYNQNLEWLKFATEQGVKESKNTYEVMSGLMVRVMSPEEIETAIVNSKEGGATGVCFYDIGSLKAGHWAVIKRLHKFYNP